LKIFVEAKQLYGQEFSMRYFGWGLPTKAIGCLGAKPPAAGDWVQIPATEDKGV